MSLTLNVMGFALVGTTMTSLSYYGLKYIWNSFKDRIRTQESVQVRTHTRRLPNSNKNLDKQFVKFIKHRNAGLKGNNKGRYQEEMIKTAKQKKMDILWIKMDNYRQVGDVAKQRAVARELERMDNMR